MDEALITRAITENFTKDFLDSLNIDVAVAGAGPSGLVCAYYLAKHGFKVSIFEKHLKVGGGMPGGMSPGGAPQAVELRCKVALASGASLEQLPE